MWLSDELLRERTSVGASENADCDRGISCARWECGWGWYGDGEDRPARGVGELRPPNGDERPS